MCVKESSTHVNVLSFILSEASCPLSPPGVVHYWKRQTLISKELVWADFPITAGHGTEGELCFWQKFLCNQWVKRNEDFPWKTVHRILYILYDFPKAYFTFVFRSLTMITPYYSLTISPPSYLLIPIITILWAFSLTHSSSSLSCVFHKHYYTSPNSQLTISSGCYSSQTVV